MATMGLFHAKAGWFFERMPDGSVRVHVGMPDAVKYHDGIPQTFVEFDAGSWASIVASVSSRGETAETFSEAAQFRASARV